MEAQISQQPNLGWTAHDSSIPIIRKTNAAKELKRSERSSEESQRRWDETRERIIRKYTYKMAPDDVKRIDHLKAELAGKIKKLADLDELERSAIANVQHLRSEIVRKEQVLEENNAKLEDAIAVKPARLSEQQLKNIELRWKTDQMKLMRANNDRPKAIIRKNQDTQEQMNAGMEDPIVEWERKAQLKWGRTAHDSRRPVIGKNNNAEELKLSEPSSEEWERTWNETRERIIRKYTYKMAPDDVKHIDRLEAELADKIKKLADLDELERSAIANVQHLRSEIVRKKQVLEEKNAELEAVIAMKPVRLSELQIDKLELRWKAAQSKLIRAGHDHRRAIIKKENANPYPEEQMNADLEATVAVKPTHISELKLNEENDNPDPGMQMIAARPVELCPEQLNRSLKADKSVTVMHKASKDAKLEVLQPPNRIHPESAEDSAYMDNLLIHGGSIKKGSGLHKLLAGIILNQIMLQINPEMTESADHIAHLETVLARNVKPADLNELASTANAKVQYLRSNVVLRNQAEDIKGW